MEEAVGGEDGGGSSGGESEELNKRFHRSWLVDLAALPH